VRGRTDRGAVGNSSYSRFVLDECRKLFIVSVPMWHGMPVSGLLGRGTYHVSLDFQIPRRGLSRIYLDDAPVNNTPIAKGVTRANALYLDGTAASSAISIGFYPCFLERITTASRLRVPLRSS
jgi:hypothetical protein